MFPPQNFENFLHSRNSTLTFEQRFGRKFHHLQSVQVRFREFPTEKFSGRRKTLPKQDLASSFYGLNIFLDQCEKGKHQTFTVHQTPKHPIGYSFSKNDLFCHHIHEIREHPKEPIDYLSDWSWIIIGFSQWRSFLKLQTSFISVKLWKCNTLKLSKTWQIALLYSPTVGKLQAIEIPYTILCSVQYPTIKHFFPKVQMSLVPS